MFLLDDDIKHKTNSIKGVNPIDNQPFEGEINIYILFSLQDR